MIWDMGRSSGLVLTLVLIMSASGVCDSAALALAMVEAILLAERVESLGNIIDRIRVGSRVRGCGDCGGELSWLSKR